MGAGCLPWTKIEPNDTVWDRQDICEVAEATEPSIEIHMFNDAKSQESYPTGVELVVMSNASMSAAISPAAGSRVIMKEVAFSNYDYYGIASKVQRLKGANSALSSQYRQTGQQAILMRGAALSSGNYYITGSKIIMREVT